MIRSANCTSNPRQRVLSALSDRRFRGIFYATLLLSVALLGTSQAALAQANPGDPLFSQPVEGTTFLIVNGGAGVFSANADCYGNNPALFDTDTTIPTSQGGTMTKTPGTANYTYTPPTATFTGLDTFPLHVLYSYNKVGGIGSAGGSAFPGTPTTLTITLNVLSSTATLAASSGTTQVPVPAGSVSGCSAVGNSQNGPLPGAIFGCVTGIQAGSVAPAHGTLVAVGNALQYTPTAGYTGNDTFSFRAQGVDNNGTKRLNSGEITIQATVPGGTGPGPVGTPALGTWMMLVLCAGMLVLGAKAAARHTA